MSRELTKQRVCFPFDLKVEEEEEEEGRCTSKLFV